MRNRFKKTRGTEAGDFFSRSRSTFSARLCTALLLGKDRSVAHTSFNHYAHLAQAWLSGRTLKRMALQTMRKGTTSQSFTERRLLAFRPSLRR